MRRVRAPTPVLLVLAGVLVLVVVGRTGIGRGELPGRSRPAPASVPATVDEALPPAGGTPWVLSRVQLAHGNEPLELVVQDGRLWAAGSGTGLLAMDEQGRQLDFGLDREAPFPSIAIAAGDDAGTVWVGRSFFDETGVTLRLERGDTRVARAGTVPPRLKLPAPVRSMAAGEGALWVACCEDDSRRWSILRLDPVTLERRASIRMPGRVCEMRVHSGWLWALDNRGNLARIDPRTNRVFASIETSVGSVPDAWYGACNAMAQAPGVIWAGGAGGTIARIDARTATLTWTDTVRVNGEPVAVHRLAADGDSLWMTSGRGELYRLNSGGHVVGAAHLNDARSVAAGGGDVWVGDDHGTVRRIDPASLPSFGGG